MTAVKIPSPELHNILCSLHEWHCWCFGHLGSGEKRRSPPENQGPPARNTRSRDGVLGREFQYFPNNFNKPTERDFGGSKDVVSLSREESSRWRRGLRPPETEEAPCRSSCEWGAAGKIQLSWIRDSHQYVPEEEPGLYGGWSVCVDIIQASSKKMVERKR